MRLISYRSDRGDRAGVLRGDEVVDVWDALGYESKPGQASVRAILDEEEVYDVQVAVADADPFDSLSGVDLLPPIPNPEKIICIGLNYRAHADEAGQDAPPVPTFFAKFRNALVADGATVRLPASSSKVDYEAEVAFVVGHTAREVPVDCALDHVAGYMLLNDLSARDLQFQTPQWIPGKVFDGSAPCGPALVTPDEAGPPDAIGLTLDLDGRRLQEGTTADLIFGVAELVAHLSTLMTLVPGDIVSTGTPAGVGSTRDPRIWLEAGNEIVVGSPQLGELRTTIG